MTSKQEDSGKTPLKKVRAGRFQISLWAFRKLFANGGKDSTIYLEQWVDVERACIQYSTYNKATAQFENQAIWCSLDDLRNLAKVVDKLNGEEDSSPSLVEEEEEEKEFSPFSFEDNEDSNEVIEFSPKVEEKSSIEKNDEVIKMIRNKSIRLKREKEDGLRICVMRFIRSYYDYDLWYRNLAPSIELLNDYKSGRIEWNEFEVRYLEEINDKKELIKKLAKLAEKRVITLLCCELDDRYCHRRLLMDAISKYNDENEVIEFSLQSEDKSLIEKNDEVNKMRRMKLFNLIKHLKSVNFYHDTFDLEDQGIEGVLGDYGICDNFSEKELQELRKDLYEMAERNELKEVMRFVDNAEVVEGMQMVEMF